jgi:hypothetical protein
MNDFCSNHLGKDLWESKTDDEKIDIIDVISEYVKDKINDRTLNEIQYGTYKSQVTDVPIKFEKEKIAKSGLFVAKKKYSTSCLWIEGDRKESIKTTGLEVVRGDSSEAVRDRLKDIMSMILRDKPDEEISKKINKYKKELMNVYPEEIAGNIGVNGLDKWLHNGKYIKGTPWHVKGVSNYRLLLKELGIVNEYEDVHEGAKCKVVYVKKNKYNMETISFLRWPKEFNKVVEVDMKVMVDKFFLNKIGILLKPMNKMSMMNSYKIKQGLNSFFN